MLADSEGCRFAMIDGRRIA